MINLGNTIICSKLAVAKRNQEWRRSDILCFWFIFLMTNNVMHLLICLLATYLSCLEKCLCLVFADFVIELLGFCYWVSRVLHLFWILNYYLIYDLQIFSSIVKVVFSLSWWSSLIHNLKKITKSNLFISSFLACFFGVISKNPLLNLKL